VVTFEEYVVRVTSLVREHGSRISKEERRTAYDILKRQVPSRSAEFDQLYETDCLAIDARPDPMQLPLRQNAGHAKQLLDEAGEEAKRGAWGALVGHSQTHPDADIVAAHDLFVARMDTMTQAAKTTLDRIIELVATAHDAQLDIRLAFDNGREEEAARIYETFARRCSTF
jgi:hypothetical protein